jgi:hypothetical protein
VSVYVNVITAPPRSALAYTMEQIPVGDGEGTLTIYPYVGEGVELMVVRRSIPGIGALEIVMQSPAGHRRQAQPANVDLIKRIAASVEVNPATRISI